jgi:glycosyltransferase involved in cell wall biosynthesis
VRLAFFTPLNPVRSGISDYSEELLPHLANLAEIDIVVGPYQPSSKQITTGFRILHAAEFLSNRRSYDCTIYQIGNNHRAHGYMIPCMAAAPGVVVLHDYSLTYLVLALTLQRGDFRTLEKILRYSNGINARLTALKLLAGLMDQYAVSLCRPVVESSTAVIVHNHHAYDRLKNHFPAVPLALIPHATPIRELPKDRVGLRHSYGFSPDDLVVASVSSLAYNKRTQLVLAALDRLRGRYPAIKFVMVGQGQLGSDVAALIKRLRLQETVVQTGWVPAQAYLDYIHISDVIIDLRSPTAGETSGSSLRAMQAAKPLIVSDEGFFSELPESCCIRVPVGNARQEVHRLQEALETLLGDPLRRTSMGTAGREFAVKNLRLEDAAASYIAFIREVIISSYKPARSWTLEASNPGGHRLLAWAYKAGRLLHSVRHYGLAGTLARIRSLSKEWQ